MIQKTRAHIGAQKKKHPLLDEAFKISMVVIGAVLVAAGLELFLVPNGFLDGGVVGVSIIVSSFFPAVPLGVFIGVLNIPFLVLSYIHAGFRSAVRTAIGIAVLSVSTLLLHRFHALTDEFFVALSAGGALLGVGVGLALRYGGALDGLETLAVTISNSSKFGVSQIILAGNLLIFTVAAFIFDAERAIASFLLFYIVVTPLIDKVMEGNNEVKMAEITTQNKDSVMEAIHKHLNRRVFIMDGVMDGDEDTPAWRLHTYVARTQEAAMAEAVEEADPDAVVVFFEAASIHGGSFKESKHH